MAIKDVFKMKRRFATVTVEPEANTNVPHNTWILCPDCKRMLLVKDLNKNLRICYECGYYFRLSANERIKYTCDEGSYSPISYLPTYPNPLGFEGYSQKRKQAITASGVDEAVVSGTCKIGEKPCVICVMDSNFMMGSMGSDVGERITVSIEYAHKYSLPLIIFTCSGGARMQEGMISLMQMAKISGALNMLTEKSLPYITVLTDPTTGGVTASFATLGDIIIAEKGALIGFAGKRVIEQTTKQKLPPDFQTAEFQLQHGFVDHIAERPHLKDTLAQILRLHS